MALSPPGGRDAGSIANDALRRERLTFGHGRLDAVRARPLSRAAVAGEPPPFRLSQPETWDWGWGGLLIFTVLLFFRPQDQVPALAVLHIPELAALLGLAAMVMLNVSRGGRPVRTTPEVVGVLALGAIILGTVPFSFWPGGSVAVFTDLFSKVALIYLLLANSVTSPRRIERICWVIVLAFGYVSLRGWFDYARGVNLVEGNRIAGAAGGFFENPNDLALNLVTFLPLALIMVKRRGPALPRLVAAAIAVLMLGTIVFTKSRSGMLGTVAMIAVFLLSTRSLTPGTLIALVLSGLVLLPAMPASFWERMQSITDAEKDTTGSRSEREELMREAVRLFLANPITGIGAGQFQNYGGDGQAQKWRVTHNAILQVAAEIGVFGLAAFVFLIVRAFSAAWWTRAQLRWIFLRRPPRGADEDGLDDRERLFLQTHAAAMLAACAGWFVCALFASVAFNWTFYYVLGLAAAARDVVRTRRAVYRQARALSLRQGAVA